MLYFPQLATGAVSQYPLRKTNLYRTIANTLEDGSRIVLADANSAAIQWQLSYSGISDAERQVLAAFFASTEGRLQSFTFFDPAGNLLGWSEALDQAAWQKNSLLSLQSAVADPLGTHRATTIANGGAGALTFGQEIEIPAALTCCFSFYARAANAQPIVLNRAAGGDIAGVSAVVGPQWERYSLSGDLPGNSTSSVFEILLGSGVSIDVFGLQVDAQSAPSPYVVTTAGGGVYASARFDMNTLTITSTGPNQNSCEMQVITHVNG